jgi:exonuclease SbcD
MLHHLAGKFELTGSEQIINLSGVESIPVHLLQRFDYVALGHIHKPQKIGPQSFYSGSPLPMRFSETLKKSVMIIDEIDVKLEFKSLAIPVFRDLIQIKTDLNSYREDIGKISVSSDLKAMAEVQIELPAPEAGLIDKIKELLESKGAELLSYIPLYQTAEVKERRSEKIFELSTLDLFQEFYKSKYPETSEVPEDLMADFSALLEKVKHASHSS